MNKQCPLLLAAVSGSKVLSAAKSPNHSSPVHMARIIRPEPGAKVS